VTSFDFTDPSLFYVLLIATIAGLLSALLGIGGGLLYVPAMTLLGATPTQAVATSLVGIAFGAVSGTIQNWRTKHLNLEQVALLVPPAMLTAELGVWAANVLPSAVILVGFSSTLVATTFLMNLKRKLVKQQVYLPEPVQVAVGGSAGDFNARADFAEAIQLKPRIIQTQLIGSLAGVMSGLLGAGGGAVMVPLQMLFLGDSVKTAVRTSLGAIAFISLYGVGRHAQSGNVQWLAGLYLGLGGLVGAQLGVRLLPKLPDQAVIWLYRMLAISLAIYMLTKAIALPQ